MNIEPAVLRVLREVVREELSLVREVVREEIREALREWPNVAAAKPRVAPTKPLIPPPPQWVDPGVVRAHLSVLDEVQRIRAALAKEKERRS